MTKLQAVNVPKVFKTRISLDNDTHGEYGNIRPQLCFQKYNCSVEN